MEQSMKLLTQTACLLLGIWGICDGSHIVGNIWIAASVVIGQIPNQRERGR